MLHGVIVLAPFISFSAIIGFVQPLDIAAVA
jgi:hypothetical protein